MNVLTFGGDYWDGPRHNRHYFLEELGRHERVLFASPPFHLARLIERKGPLYPSGVRRINDGLVNYTPSKWLFENHRSPWLNAKMKAARLRRIEALMRQFGVTDPVLLIWHPQYRDMIGRFGEQLVIYYAYDQYTGYTGGDAKASPAEIELMERADLVFALSRELAADKRQIPERAGQGGPPRQRRQLRHVLDVAGAGDGDPGRPRGAARTASRLHRDDEREGQPAGARGAGRSPRVDDRAGRARELQGARGEGAVSWPWPRGPTCTGSATGRSTSCRPTSRASTCA